MVCSWEGVWGQPAHRGCDVISGHRCSTAGTRLNGKAKAKRLLCCEKKEENSWLSPLQGSSWEVAIRKQELQGREKRGGVNDTARQGNGEPGCCGAEPAWQDRTGSIPRGRGGLGPSTHRTPLGRV